MMIFLLPTVLGCLTTSSAQPPASTCGLVAMHKCADDCGNAEHDHLIYVNPRYIVTIKPVPPDNLAKSKAGAVVALSKEAYGTSEVGAVREPADVLAKQFATCR